MLQVISILKGCHDKYCDQVTTSCPASAQVSQHCQQCGSSEERCPHQWSMSWQPHHPGEITGYPRCWGNNIPISSLWNRPLSDFRRTLDSLKWLNISSTKPVFWLKINWLMLTWRIWKLQERRKLWRLREFWRLLSHVPMCWRWTFLCRETMAVMRWSMDTEHNTLITGSTTN